MLPTYPVAVLATIAAAFIAALTAELTITWLITFLPTGTPLLLSTTGITTLFRLEVVDNVGKLVIVGI